jgi:DNA-binding Lrp family transcriptional regulator
MTAPDVVDPADTPAASHRTSVKLDALDRAIVETLRRDSRTSSRAIGRELGVAAGTVGQRIARLASSGVIKGYTAVVDESLLGRSLAFVVGLQITQGNNLDGALDELIALDEVDEVLVVTGRWDLLVLGKVRDPEELNQLLTKGLWQSPSFRHSETMLVINGRSSALRAVVNPPAD